MSSRATLTFQHYDCWVCGMPFGLSAGTVKAFVREHTPFHCPKGCRLRFGKSDADVLREQLDTQMAATQRANRRLQDERRSHAGTKGALTKAKRRIAAGVCPCCSRSFKQLRRHMQSQHPEYLED